MLYLLLAIPVALLLYFLITVWWIAAQVAVPDESDLEYENAAEIPDQKTWAAQRA